MRAFDLPDDRLWDRLGADWDLDALFPLLPPRVGEYIVVFCVELVRVVHLHGSDQVRSKNLRHEDQGQCALLSKNSNITAMFDKPSISYVNYKNVSNVSSGR